MNFDIEKLAIAINKLAAAASSKLGSDCYLHAALTKEILAENGIQCEIHAGYAAWRVGNGDGDVIQHYSEDVPLFNSINVPYHVWLTVEDYIVDFTTYQLREKAFQLDKMDGGHTVVDWSPDFLVTRKDQVSSIDEVRSLHQGMFYYEEIPEIEEIILKTASPTLKEEVDTLRLIYQNPEIDVMGINHANPAAR